MWNLLIKVRALQRDYLYSLRAENKKCSRDIWTAARFFVHLSMLDDSRSVPHFMHHDAFSGFDKEQQNEMFQMVARAHLTRMR